MTKSYLIAKWQGHIDILMARAKASKSVEEFRECIRAAFTIQRRIDALKGEQ